MAKTTIEVCYPPERGGIELRGSLPPLSWYESAQPALVDGNRFIFEVDLGAGELLEFKPMRADGRWACGRNFSLLAGETLVVAPYFDRGYGVLEAEVQRLHSPQLERELRYRVFLPPSYEEHQDKSYPVLYAQDGQNLFTPDPLDGHSWQMDDALNELYELGAIEEVIVVALYTDEGRLEMLSPTPDSVHGGGDGPKYRDFLIDTLKPEVDASYRTVKDRRHTALIGSSMGGLFSFFAAWTRGNVFGRAACLSSSFWWDDRSMVREVQKGMCPVPRPWLYLDSGAARGRFEEDANLRDGFHHTMALRSALVNHCYVPGDNIHALAFAGMSHNNASWAARLAVPLQLLFPRKG